MSIKTFPIIINSDLYSKTWKDSLYNEMNDYVYYVSKYKDLTDEGKILSSIGRRDISVPVYEELFFYKLLIDYLINLKEALYKSGVEDDQEVIDSYKLDKIRKNIFCRFGTTNVFDKLLEIVNLYGYGIDFMEIGCLIDTEGSELQTNEDFLDSELESNINDIVLPIASSSALFRTGSILTVGYYYRIIFTIDTGSASVDFYDPQGAPPFFIFVSNINTYTTGTYSVDVEALGQQIGFNLTSSSISAITIQRIILSGFSQILRSSPFTVSSTNNISTGSGFNLSVLRDSTLHLLSNVVLTIGSTYKITFEVTILTSGKNVQLYESDGVTPHTLIYTANLIGTYIIDYTAIRTGISFYTNASDFLGDEAFIKNVSIKEVTATSQCDSSDNPFIIE